MTVSEMHQAFRLQLDKSSSLVGNPDFLPEEIDYWLNEAQDRFIKQRLYGNNFKQERFDNIQKRIDDLRSLVVCSNKISLTQSALASNVKECVLPVLSGETVIFNYDFSSLSGLDIVNNGVNDTTIIVSDQLRLYLAPPITSGSNNWIKVTPSSITLVPGTYSMSINVVSKTTNSTIILSTITDSVVITDYILVVGPNVINFTLTENAIVQIEYISYINDVEISILNDWSLNKQVVSDIPYLFYINSSVYNSSSIALQTSGIIEYKNISDYLKDFINNPYIRRPLVTFYSDKIAFVHGDEFTPTTCDITYIKRPKKLVSGIPGTYETNICELSIHTHPEIVIIAVDIVIENTESIRTQTFEQINASKVE
jgi:hypothetical protein